MPKVLIIDDSLLQRIKAKKLLHENGFDVDECTSAEEGLLLSNQYDYDIILLDLLMTGIGGLGFLTSEEVPRSTPILVISAEIQDSVKQKCLDLGACGFLSKPLDDSTLLKAVERYMNHA